MGYTNNKYIYIDEKRLYSKTEDWKLKLKIDKVNNCKDKLLELIYCLKQVDTPTTQRWTNTLEDLESDMVDYIISLKKK
jgi:hypothetical protein